jgi:hypothetical protein
MAASIVVRCKSVPNRITRMLALIGCALLAPSVAQPASASQQQRPAPSPGLPAAGSAASTGESARRATAALRTATAPVIDGSLDDAAWQQVQPTGGFVQRAPDPGAPATQSTELRVLYDDGAVYIALRMWDDAADAIVARLARRDEAVHSDWVHVQIGSMNDGRTAFVFGVNPRGVQRDVLISDDNMRSASWNAVWQAATSVDAEGWTAELRIPLSQLRFSSGSSMWAFNVERVIARRAETSHWSPTPPDAAGIVSHFGVLTGLAGLSAPRRIELRPYVLGSITRAPVEAGNPFHTPNSLLGSAGADLQYGLTGALTLSATINPDFGQVEADPAEINLTAYESFVQERRPFFVEGAELFRSGGPNLFYSRRIGRAPRAPVPDDAAFTFYPNATSILGAAKLTGRVRGWTVGALGALTAVERAQFVTAAGTTGEAIVEPLTSYGVLRVRREADGGRRAFGILATAVNRRQGDDARLRLLPASAYAASADARARMGEHHEVYGSVSGSAVFGSEEAIARLQRSATHRFQRTDAPHLEFDPARTRMIGHAWRAGAARIGGGPWRWNTALTAFSPGFGVNDAGFLNNVDRVRAFVSGGYEKTRAGSRLRSGELTSFLISEWTFGGERLLTVLDVDTRFTLPSHRGAVVWVQREFRGLAVDALRGGPALVAPGQVRLYAGGHTDRRKPLHGSASVYVEREDDSGSLRTVMSTSLQFRPSNALEASLGPRLQRSENAWQFVSAARDAAGDRYVAATVQQTTASLTARLSYALSPALSFQLYAEPFVGGTDYAHFKEVVAPRAERLEDRFHVFGDDEVEYDAVRRRYTATRTGMQPIEFGRPDFRQTSLRSTAVLRWEYRPGSSLFVVWGSERETFTRDERLLLRRDALGAFRGHGSNTLLVKANYWLGL